MTMTHVIFGKTVSNLLRVGLLLLPFLAIFSFLLFQYSPFISVFNL
jgi:hypothetical protein